MGGTSGRWVGWVGQGEVSGTMGGEEMGRRCGWDKEMWVGQGAKGRGWMRQGKVGGARGGAPPFPVSF